MAAPVVEWVLCLCGGGLDDDGHCRGVEDEGDIVMGDALGASADADRACGASHLSQSSLSQPIGASPLRVEHIGRATLYLGDARTLLPSIGPVDHIITDPPYSDRTHRGHDLVAGVCRDSADRIALGYDALNADLVEILSGMFCDACDGWIVWMSDHTLAPSIERSLSSRDRYVFAPLPYFHAGRSVRLTGDGPCSWTDWIIPARTKRLSKWGTLPGGYVASDGWSDKERMGGKPTRLMRLMVTHYSRPDELVCDPFMGAGTTGVACMKEGRRFVGVEIDPEAFELSCRRIEDAQRQGDFFVEAAA
jgi:site-specific DNA-methyltransferase (adenine-specific)